MNTKSCSNDALNLPKVLKHTVFKFQPTVMFNKFQSLLFSFKIQYNTAIQLIFDIALLTRSSEERLHASAAQMQRYCRAIVTKNLLTISNEARTRTLCITGRLLLPIGHRDTVFCDLRLLE